MIEYTGIGNKKYSIVFRLFPSIEFTYLKYRNSIYKNSFIILFGWLFFSWRIEILKVLCNYCKHGNSCDKDIVRNFLQGLDRTKFIFCKHYDEVKNEK